jgi:hypothetical protein
MSRCVLICWRSGFWQRGTEWTSYQTPETGGEDVSDHIPGANMYS